MIIGAEEEKALICWDFDETISNQHVHGFCTSEGIKPGQAGAKEIVEAAIAYGGFKNREATLAAMREAMKNGHKMAITSYTLYPEVIPLYLIAMGLTEDEVAQIPVIGGFPSKVEPGTIDLTGNEGLDFNYGKSLHIEAAKKAHGIKHNKVILIDDSKGNCKVAQSQGQIGILVPKFENPPIGYLNDLLNEIATPSASYNHGIIDILEKLEENLTEDKMDLDESFKASMPLKLQQVALTAAQTQIDTVQAIIISCREKMAHDSETILDMDAIMAPYKNADDIPESFAISIQSEIAKIDKPGIIEESLSSQLGIDVVGVGGGRLEEYPNRPGKTYVVFDNAADQVRAHDAITREFGEGASRMAGQKGTIEIKDAQVVEQLKRELGIEPVVEMMVEKSLSSQLNVDVGRLTEYAKRPGKTYVVFDNEADQVRAQAAIISEYGVGASRIAGQPNTIEIQNAEVIRQLRRELEIEPEVKVQGVSSSSSDKKVIREPSGRKRATALAWQAEQSFARTSQSHASQLGVDVGRLTEYAKRPGKTYVVFDNTADRDSAHAAINSEYGPEASRVAGLPNTIEIQSAPLAEKLREELEMEPEAVPKLKQSKTRR